MVMVLEKSSVIIPLNFFIKKKKTKNINTKRGINKTIIASN